MFSKQIQESLENNFSKTTFQKTNTPLTSLKNKQEAVFYQYAF
jgi:hypothetical protein